MDEPDDEEVHDREQQAKTERNEWSKEQVQGGVATELGTIQEWGKFGIEFLSLIIMITGSNIRDNGQYDIAY